MTVPHQADRADLLWRIHRHFAESKLTSFYLDAGWEICLCWSWRTWLDSTALGRQMTGPQAFPTQRQTKAAGCLPSLPSLHWTQQSLAKWQQTRACFPRWSGAAQTSMSVHFCATAFCSGICLIAISKVAHGSFQYLIIFSPQIQAFMLLQNITKIYL